MRYNQIDHALTFLTKPSDTITLQVPWHRDIELVRSYIIRKYGKPIWQTRDTMKYPFGSIRFEVVSNELCGIGVDCCFLIERAHDNSWIERLGIEVCHDTSISNSLL